jgi:anti-anti-sigma factor
MGNDVWWPRGDTHASLVSGGRPGCRTAGAPADPSKFAIRTEGIVVGPPSFMRQLDERRPASPLDGTAGFLVTQDNGSSDGLGVFVVRGALDAHTAPRLKALLLAAVRRGRSTILVDLDPCASIDSTGLGVLCDIGRLLRAPDGTPGLVAVTTKLQVARVFALGRVERLVPLLPSRDEGLAALDHA